MNRYSATVPAVSKSNTMELILDVLELQEFARLYSKPLNFFVN